MSRSSWRRGGGTREGEKERGGERKGEKVEVESEEERKS